MSFDYTACEAADIMPSYDDNGPWAVYARGHVPFDEFLIIAEKACAFYGEDYVEAFKEALAAGEKPEHTYWRWIPISTWEHDFKVLPSKKGRGAVPVTCLSLDIYL